MTYRIEEIEITAEELKAMRPLQRTGGVIEKITTALFGTYEDEEEDKNSKEEGDEDESEICEQA